MAAFRSAAAVTTETRCTIQIDKRDDPEFSDFIVRKLEDICREYDALLEVVEPNVDRKLKDVAPIERGLLAIGAWELTHRLDIPYRVVIDEAVELAKAYGGTDGHKFVNGVLDKIVPRLRAAEVRAGSRDE